jgi:hypothetical protein
VLIAGSGRADAANANSLLPLPSSAGDDLVALAAPFERTAWPVDGVGVEFGRWQIPRQTRAVHLSGDPIEVFVAQDAAGWRIEGPGVSWTELSRASGRAGAVSDAPLLARVGYRVAGTPLAMGGGRFKQALLLGALRGRRDADVWVLATACLPDCSAARGRLDAAMSQAAAWMGSNGAPPL